MRVPENEILNRRKGFWKLLREKGSPPDYVLFLNENNVRYLTGFTGNESALLISPRLAALITDFRFVEQAGKSCVKTRVHKRTSGFIEEVRKIIHTPKASGPVLGFEDDKWTIAFHARSRKKLRGWKIRPLPPALKHLRKIKSNWEIRRIRKAVRIQEYAAIQWRARLRPGMTEREAAALLRFILTGEAGAEAESFESIVAFNVNASMPHYIPGKARLKKNSLVLVDWGAKIDGYCSDMTRTFFLGSPRPKLLKIHNIVLEAQKKAVKMTRSGVAVREVDAAAREYIDSAGYGRFFEHSTGHGVGLEVHEGPVVSKSRSEILEPGNIITVEPGVYVPRLGGVRIEDDILVTRTGRKNLSSLPKDPTAPWE